ncbi:MAG: hemerythrin domain-containing protein [Microbispora sp.]|nr:hemerythrin domain-containing protein [Microbispora sp.]
MPEEDLPGHPRHRPLSAGPLTRPGARRRTGANSRGAAGGDGRATGRGREGAGHGHPGEAAGPWPGGGAARALPVLPHGLPRGQRGLAGLPLPERAFPGLAPTLGRLREEHVRPAEIREDLRAAVAESGSGDPAALRDRLTRLSAELEAHFAREEEQLLAALNAL